KDGSRLIAESSDFVALAPYAPRFPFETWLLPKRHASRFEDASRGEYASLARMVKDTLQRMNHALLSPPYNLIVHSSPLPDNAGGMYPPIGLVELLVRSEDVENANDALSRHARP